MKYLATTICFLLILRLSAQDNTPYKVWRSDNGNGTYTNPIIHADFSDPDAIRVGNDYYMTASSFNCAPGLPILHSKDLVNWKLINYALPKQVPLDVFDKPQHGNGVWAPCIRYHNNVYYIFYPDPDFGIYMIHSKNPEQQWSEPLLIKAGKGLIDPSPLWDTNGKAYLAYAFAGSRAGIKSMLMVCSMAYDCTKTYKDDVMVFDGHKNQKTIEGPKFYKRNGYYYIFAPAGGVSTGWQLALRSKHVLGPYDVKRVMEQGDTDINGPHQGAWVTTPSGDDWFIHFQDKNAYGRIVHLQPMTWKENWPIIGKDQGNGIGTPVKTYNKPNIKKDQAVFVTPQDSDEFNSPKLGLQWQWHANPELYWGFPTSYGHFKLFCRPEGEDFKNLWHTPNLLLQKWPAETFTATTKLTFSSEKDNDRAGILIMGRSYAYLQIKKEQHKLSLSQVVCNNADKGGKEIEIERIPIKTTTIYFKVSVAKQGICKFYYSTDGTSFKSIGQPFTAVEGKWIGSKIGYFALRKDVTNNSGYMDIDWIRFTKN